MSSKWLRKPSKLSDWVTSIFFKTTSSVSKSYLRLNLRLTLKPKKLQLRLGISELMPILGDSCVFGGPDRRSGDFRPRWSISKFHGFSAVNLVELQQRYLILSRSNVRTTDGLEFEVPTRSGVPPLEGNRIEIFSNRAHRMIPQWSDNYLDVDF